MGSCASHEVDDGRGTITVGSLNYSGIVTSPYEFYESEGEN